MSTSDRNYGIDLLKCIAMFMIVTLHVLGQGGILNASKYGTAHYNAAWLLEISAYCAVNCYALISGYNYTHSHFRLYKLILLWVQVVFYTLLITALFVHFNPDLNTPKTWFSALFPATTNQYWYFSSYFGMFFLIPILNHTLTIISKKYTKLLTIVLFLFISILPTFSQTDPYQFNSGYSTLWLCTMYLLGGFIFNCHLEEKISKWLSFFTYILMILITWYVKTHFIEGGFIVRYTSPTMIIAAIALLLLFVNRNFKTKFICKIISTLTALSFSVYLIHTHPLIFSNIISQAFVSLLWLKPEKMCIIVFMSALEIYLLCTLIDAVRLFIFETLHISNLLQHLFPLEIKIDK